MKILMSSIILMVLFSTCKKYPEDGKWSFHTPKNRLENKWELKECMVDGIDMVNLLQILKYINPSNQLEDSAIYTLNNFRLDIKNYITRINGKLIKVYDAEYSVTNILRGYGCICAASNWKLIDYKNKIKFDHSFKKGFGYGTNLIYLNLLYNESNELWNINKLTDKELQLESVNSNGQTVKLKFNKL